MELPDFSLPMIQGFLICLARVGAMFGSIPVFSGGQTPVQIRVGMAFLFSLVVWPVVQDTMPDKIYEPLEFGVLVAQQTILGLMVGMLGQLVMMAAEFAGSLIGYQMGFAAANVFDPTTQRQVALVSQFQGVFAILLFLAFDVHHLFIEAIVASFKMLPPDQLNLSGGAVQMIVDYSNHALILSVRLVAPILVILILSNLILGVMSRVFPQLNVFMLSFPLNIGTSLIIMGLVFSVFARSLAQEFSLLTDRFLQLFNLL